MKDLQDKPHFDAIVGNPPYQRNISGSTKEVHLRNASKSVPIYQDFVTQVQGAAHDVALVTPARWVAGGWGLAEFRQKLLTDNLLREMWIYNNSATVFENTSVNGGISVLHFGETHVKQIRIKNYDRHGALIENSQRKILEDGADFFVRDGVAVGILDKIGSFSLKENERFSSMINGAISGFNSNFSDYTLEKQKDDDLLLVLIKWRETWVEKSLCKDSQTDGYRVLFQLSHGEGDPSAMSRAFLYAPGVTYSHSHLGTNALASEEAGMSVLSYVNTRFFRYLCFLLKITIVATSQVYRLIPIQTWDRLWTDEELFKKYGLTEKEIKHIEETISAPREIHRETELIQRRAWTL